MAAILKEHDCDHEPSPLGVPSPAVSTAIFELYLCLQEFSQYSRHLHHRYVRRLPVSLSIYLPYYLCHCQYVCLQSGLVVRMLASHENGRVRPPARALCTCGTVFY